MAKKKRIAKAGAGKRPRYLGMKERYAFLVGILVFMLGLGLMGNELTSLRWRWNAKWNYRQGSARIEKTEIAKREGSFDLDITYHLEIDGRSGQSVTRQERDDPSAPTLEDAQKRQTRYPAGALVPCWYSPENPDGFHELALDGLDEWRPIRRLWMPSLVLVAGVLLCRPLWKGKLSPEDQAAADRDD